MRLWLICFVHFVHVVPASCAKADLDRNFSDLIICLSTETRGKASRHQVGHARLIANQHTPHIAGRNDLPNPSDVCRKDLPCFGIFASKPKGFSRIRVPHRSFGILSPASCVGSAMIWLFFG